MAAASSSDPAAIFAGKRRYQAFRDKMAKTYREKMRVHLYQEWGKEKRCTAGKKLVLRSAPHLESTKIGDIRAGTSHLLVLEQTVVDGVVRARIGKDSTPRGLAVVSLGWVTAVKDGELKLEPSEDNGSPPQWNFLTSSAADATEGSMSSRIAARRQSQKPSKVKAKAKTTRERSSVNLQLDSVAEEDYDEGPF